MSFWCPEPKPGASMTTLALQIQSLSSELDKLKGKIAEANAGINELYFKAMTANCLLVVRKTDEKNLDELRRLFD